MTELPSARRKKLDELTALGQEIEADLARADAELAAGETTPLATCEGCEVCELASELAVERTLHQQTMAERDRLHEALDNIYCDIGTRASNGNLTAVEMRARMWAGDALGADRS